MNPAPVKELTILQVLNLLDKFVDNSDPDFDDAQIYHAFQTAERVRALFPTEPWLHVTALIHDAGKVSISFLGVEVSDVHCRFSHIL